MPTNIYTVEIDGKQYDLEGDHPPSEAEARGAIGATTPKQATAPPAAATAGMMKPNTPNDSTFPTPDQLLNKWQESPALVARGARDVTRGNIAKGGNEMLGGAATFTAPVTIPATLGAAALAPVATAVGVGSGLLGGAASGATARKLGATPDQADLAQNLGGIAAGGLAARAYNNGPGIIEGLRRIGGVSTARAGQNIQASMNGAANSPIDLSAVRPALEEAQAKAAYLGSRKAINTLVKRVADPANPILAPEGQRAASALSALAQSAKPAMRQPIMQLSQALRGATGDAADQAATFNLGVTARPGQYQEGIDEYRRAMAARSLAKKLGVAAGTVGALDWVRRTRVGQAAEGLLK